MFSKYWVDSISYVTLLCSPSVPSPLKATRSKESFRKYVDSVLQKSAKIRSLIGDLKKNYSQDDAAMKCLCINLKCFKTTDHVIANSGSDNQKWNICIFRNHYCLIDQWSPRYIPINRELFTCQGQSRPWKLTWRHWTTNITPWAIIWPRESAMIIPMRHLATSKEL